MAKKLGIALGSGGAKGIAHLGFLQVLEENEIPISYIAGTSMGSIVGGLYSAGIALDELISAANELNLRKVVDVDLFFLKRQGFVKGNKASEMLKQYIGDMTFEETKIPFSCAAIDIMTGEEVLLNKGVMWKSMIASSAIPGIFMPQELDGKMLIDGGLLNRVPIEIVRNMGADIVIGVDVLGEIETEVMPKNIVETVVRAYIIMDWYITQKSLNQADILAMVNQKDVDQFRFKNMDKSIEAGRVAALKVLPQIQEAMKIKPSKKNWTDK